MDSIENQPKNVKDSLRQRFKLKRTEIVALFNAFGRYVQKYQQLCILFLHFTLQNQTQIINEIRVFVFRLSNSIYELEKIRTMTEQQ